MRLPQDRILHIDIDFENGKVKVVTEWQGELVRCKDCKNWRESHSEDEESYCYIDGRTTDSTGYCSWGERKEPLPQYEEWQDEFNKMCESARPKTFVADEWYRDTFGENNEQL